MYLEWDETPWECPRQAVKGARQDASVLCVFLLFITERPSCSYDGGQLAHHEHSRLLLVEMPSSSLSDGTFTPSHALPGFPSFGVVRESQGKTYKSSSSALRL